MAFLETSKKMYYLESDLGLAFLLYFKCHTVGNSPDRYFSQLLFKYLRKCVSTSWHVYVFSCALV